MNIFRMLKAFFAVIIMGLLFTLNTAIYAQDTTTTDHQMETQDTSMHQEHHEMMGDMKSEMKEMHENMKDLESTGDPDYDFAQMMIEHHKGGIALSEAQVDEGKADSLIAIARQIIEDQEKEIDSLEEFVSNHQPQKQTTDEMTGGGEHLMKGMDEMMQEMQGMEMKDDQDHNYAQMITMHHQHAIDMATNYLSHGKDENLKKMAQDMIDKNKSQIERIETWKNTHE